MKQIEQILNNLTADLGCALVRSNDENGDHILEIPGLYSAYKNAQIFAVSRRIDTLGLEFLICLLEASLPSTHMPPLPPGVNTINYNKFIYKNKIYFLNLEKLIFELAPPPPVLQPCLHCGHKLGITKTSINSVARNITYFTECNNDDCSAMGPSSNTEEEVIQKHNEMYRRIYD